MSLDLRRVLRLHEVCADMVGETVVLWDVKLAC